MASRYLANVLEVDAPDSAPAEPLPLLGLVELPLEDGEQAGDAIVQPAGAEASIRAKHYMTEAVSREQCIVLLLRTVRTNWQYPFLGKQVQ